MTFPNPPHEPERSGGDRVDAEPPAASSAAQPLDPDLGDEYEPV